MKKILLAILAVACAGGLQAQDPLSADAKFWYTSIKGYVIRAAEKMPEANYSFKPAPDGAHVRPDRRAHRRRSIFLLRDRQGQNQETEIEKTVTSKADLMRS